MGLLDAFKQYIANALPGGLLNPETKPVANQAKYIGGLLDPNSPISKDAQNWHKRTQIGLADQLAGRQTPEAEQAYQTMMQAAGIAPVGMMKAVAPRTEAMETARKNAVKMLGLPENNTAMDRARAMGAIDAYHGSPNPEITSFDLSKVGKNSGNSDRAAIWASTEPKNADGYALNWDSYKANPELSALDSETSQILRKISESFSDKHEFERLRKELDSVHARKSSLYDRFLNYGLESNGSTVYPLKILDGKSFPVVDAGGSNYAKINNAAVDSALNANNSGVVIKNVKDNAGTFSGSADSIAVFDPSRIRSRFAAFDPARRHEADILGRATPEMMGLTGLGGLLGLGALKYNDQ